MFFAWLFAKARRKITDPALKVYHRNAFWVKVIAALCYSLFVLYIMGGDTTSLYFPEGHNLYTLILKDPSNIQLVLNPGSEMDANLLHDPGEIGYFSDDSVFIVIRLVTFLCFFTFGKYLVINLVFAMIAFTGLWKLYLFFYNQYPQLHKQFAIAVLFLPTLTFWSSGILKDTLAIAALGWFTYCLYEITFYKRSLIKNGMIIVICLYIFSVIKVYIIVAYCPLLLFFCCSRMPCSYKTSWERLC